jgi:hypothetical protein
MTLDRRTFIAGAVGLAAGATMTALLLDARRRRGDIPEAQAPAGGTQDSCPTDLPVSDLDLDRLQRTTAHYYLHETNPDNELVRDKTDPNAPCSIAAVGLALASLPVAVERGVYFRPFAAKRARRRLRYLYELPQGEQADASGYKGFFYHFLDIQTGRRVWRCELSTMDSAILFAGALTAATYFDQDSEDEAEVRRLADALYSRADWRWAWNGGPTISQGWRSETGFLPYRYEGYDESLLLYLLALGSPTFPVPAESYAAYCSSYQWKKIYDRDLLYSGPLFTHQLSHLWVDFRGIRDAFMRSRDCDYFENSRRATYVQQAYAIHNPRQFAGYEAHCFGITACDGPGPCRRVVNGEKRDFFGYVARGAPFGPDDGTLAPWAVVSSLPFAPEIVIPTICHLSGMKLGGQDRQYGFKPSFNPSFAVEDSPTGWWMTPYYFGIDQGPVALMIENYRTGMIWNIMRRCPYLVAGLRRAGFSGGWL